MQIPLMPNYNAIACSGCSLKWANFISRKRDYAQGCEYTTINLYILPVFDFIIIHPWGRQYNYPLIHKQQLLTVDHDIDYYSFISLN